MRHHEPRKVSSAKEIDELRCWIEKNDLVFAYMLLDLVDDGQEENSSREIVDSRNYNINKVSKVLNSDNTKSYKIDLDLTYDNNTYSFTEWFILDTKNAIFEHEEVYRQNE